MKIKLEWDKDTKYFMIIMAGVLLLAIGICGVSIKQYCNVLNREFNAAVASMLDSVKEGYPEVSEEAMMAVLGDRNTNSGFGEELLKKYGIFPEDVRSTFPRIGRAETRFLAVFGVEGLLTAAAVLIVLLIYLMRRQGEINRLCSYVSEVCKGKFSLDVFDNRDSELSSLKNELYKLASFLREQAKEAVDNRKALADSVADISHQLKTPITSVTVLVDNLMENQEMDIGIRKRFLQEISNQLSGVTWLVSTLLKLSRLDAGVVELEKNYLELKPLAENVYDKLELLTQWRQVELKIRITGHVCVIGDASWLTEAFINLVKNAIEHSRPEGRVEMTAEENEVYTLVTVRDYGDGINEEEQKHLFERFYRGRSAGADSVGIGLALSKEIIVRHGGYISVESEEGKGTTFFVKFIKCH